MTTCRRSFLGMLAAAAGAFASDGTAAAGGRRLRLAVQMWSVEKLWKKDLPGTFAKLRAMGYEGVQSLAFLDQDRKLLEKALKDNGLVVVDMPFRRKMMAPDKIGPYLEFCDQFGVKFVYDPWEPCKTADEWRKVADELAELGTKLSARGMRVGYHNHRHELETKYEGGVTPMDILADRGLPFELDVGHVKLGGGDPVAWLKRLAARGMRVGYHNHRHELETKYAGGLTPMDILADRGLPFELDVGHVKLGGGDPVAWLKRLAGRVPSIHAKPGGGNATGCAEDANDWSAILPAARAAGAEWAVVECETRRDSFEDVDVSAKYLLPRI